MGEHVLKTWPEPFQALWDGRKSYEVRRNDRPFAVGDRLVLREWVPEGRGYSEPGYTGRVVLADVGYTTPGGQWGLPHDVCVLGLLPGPQRIDGAAP